MRSTWARLRRLGADGCLTLLEVWALYPLVRLGLVLLPLPRLRRLLAARRPVEAMSPVDCDRLAYLTERGLRPWRARCLARALVLSALLARRRVANRLVIGVRLRAGQRLAAHAWVEVAGQPLPRHERPAPFERLTVL